MGQALAEECIALGVDLLLEPGNNMRRTPSCGRNFEYFSEDPFLGGEVAASWINGIQSLWLISLLRLRLLASFARALSSTASLMALSGCQQTIDIPLRWETMESFIVPAKV